MEQRKTILVTNPKTKQPIKMEWTTEKPSKPCLFVTGLLRGKQWFYEVFELIEQKDDDGNYMLLDNEGNLEYFTINDFKADKYLILPKHK